MTAKRLGEQFGKARATLGPAGRRVLDYIERHPVAALASSAAELGASSATSDATVVRTVQALGYEGLADFKKALVGATTQGVTPADDMRRTLAQMAQSTSDSIETVLRAHEEGLATLRLPETQSQLASAALALDQASRIVLFGIGPSAGLARSVATSFQRIGRPSRTLDQTGSMLADQLLDLGPGDVLLILAYGRLYREVAALFATARELRLPTVLITERSSGKLAGMADTVVAVPRGRPGQTALHGTTLVALETLVLALSASRPQASLASLDRLARFRRLLTMQA